MPKPNRPAKPNPSNEAKKKHDDKIKMIMDRINHKRSLKSVEEIRAEILSQEPSRVVSTRNP